MKVRHFEQIPKAQTVFPKLLRTLVQKPGRKPKILPQVEYVVDQLKIDSAHLSRYKNICGFEQTDHVPAIYLAVLAQSLQMHMMTSEPFPFALLGLVHIRNRIKQYRKIQAHETIALSCRFGDLQPHDKGLQFDFIITAKIADEVVMEGLTTYLSRQKVTEKPTQKAKSDRQPQYQTQATWQVAENTGRRYAPISGDFNLIHIHALTAKAFGFKQAIAHGMWTKAKVLAALNPLPEAYEADIWFKLPIFLPSSIVLQVAKDGAITDVLVNSAKDNKPHLSGEIKALA